jgi:uncharacterized protein YacL
MPVSAVIHIVRVIFVVLCIVLGASLAMGSAGKVDGWVGALGGMGFGGLIVVIDMLLKNFTIRSFSSGTFGLLIGVLCAWLVTQIPGVQFLPEQEDIKRALHLMLYCALGYIGVVLALRSNRQEFSLIIPYVRFRNEGVVRQPLLVDTNILIDSRLPGICSTGFLGGQVVVPRFVLDELHLLADSVDPVKRDRGRRGLDCLEELRRTPRLEVSIHDDYQPQEKLVDTKLIQVAKMLDARLLTNDANLGRVAQLQGVAVLNLKDLAQAMRPIFNVGDELELPLVKEGRDTHQAVGYTPEGTMIVVNHARDKIGATASVIVSSALQTSAGRLVFAELKPPVRGPSAPAPTAPAASQSQPPAARPAQTASR